MHILHLPLEILDLILHDSILLRTLPRALRLKLVCSESAPLHIQPVTASKLTRRVMLQNRFVHRSIVLISSQTC